MTFLVLPGLQRRLWCSMESDLITVEALKLSPYERAQIAEALMQSLQDEAQAARDAAWSVWAEEQATLALNGQLPSQDGPAFLAKLRRQVP
jgi:hypothetical protein